MKLIANLIDHYEELLSLEKEHRIHSLRLCILYVQLVNERTDWGLHPLDGEKFIR